MKQLGNIQFRQLQKPMDSIVVNKDNEEIILGLLFEETQEFFALHSSNNIFINLGVEFTKIMYRMSRSIK